MQNLRNVIARSIGGAYWPGTSWRRDELVVTNTTYRHYHCRRHYYYDHYNTTARRLTRRRYIAGRPPGRQLGRPVAPSTALIRNKSRPETRARSYVNFVATIGLGNRPCACDVLVLGLVAGCVTAWCRRVLFAKC